MPNPLRLLHRDMVIKPLSVNRAAPHTGQLTANQLCRRLQCKHIGRARSIGIQHDITNAGTIQTKAQNRPQIVLMPRYVLYMKAFHPNTGNGRKAAGPRRLDTQYSAFCKRIASIKGIFLTAFPVQGCQCQRLLAIAQKRAVARNFPVHGDGAQIQDPPHQQPLLIILRRNKTPLGSRIRRIRHCSPARPADRP